MPDGSSNPYIRTFAKDMAAMSAKTGVAPVPLPKAGKKGSDREAVLERLHVRASQAPAHENTVLPSSLPMPVPKAASTDVPLEAAASPVPTVPAPVPAPPAQMPMMPAGPVATVARAPVVPPLPSAPAAPQIPHAPRAVPMPSPEPVAPIPQLIPKVPAPSPIHTYSSDFGDRIDSKGASAFSVLAAQADSGAEAPQAVPLKKSRRGLLITIASVGLMLVGASGLYAAFLYVSSHRAVPVAPTVPSLIFADDRQAVSGEGQDLMQALVDSAKTPPPDGQVRVLYLTEATTSPAGVKETVPLPGGSLIGALQLSAPDILLRNLAPESTVGIVHAGQDARAFFILRVLSYESTFAGMLGWEPTMPAVLAQLYPPYDFPPPSVATTTAVVKGKTVVSTTTAAAAPPAPPRFVDEVASNHDVRAYKDALGRTIFLYGYVDKATLVIARNEAAFAELVNRLSATKQQ